MAPRILILSASVGAGHMRAGEALEVALRRMVPHAEVRHLDILEMTNRVFRHFYAQSYLDLVNKAPHVLGYFYDLLDRPVRPRSTGDWLRQVLQKLNLTTFIRFLKKKPWDLVINTHFLPAEMIAILRKKKEIDLPQVIATTDFDTHRLWVNQPCERYFAATSEGGLYLQSWGVKAEDIHVTGIPVHPDFADAKDRPALARKHGLDIGRPVVLQLAGGFGVGPIGKLLQALLEIRLPLQIVTVAGRNDKLRDRLQALPPPERHQVKILGFTREIDELMCLADVVVSKPGGLTTSETLASGAVMVIVNPIPGQESRNSDFLLESGAAIKANNAATLGYKVENLLRDQDRLERMRANVRRAARPLAAFEVAARSLELIGVSSNGQ